MFPTVVKRVAPITQLVEWWSYEPQVAGSSPAGSIDGNFFEVQAG